MAHIFLLLISVYYSDNGYNFYDFFPLLFYSLLYSFSQVIYRTGVGGWFAATLVRKINRPEKQSDLQTPGWYVHMYICVLCPCAFVCVVSMCVFLLHADANNGEVRHGSPWKINGRGWREEQKTRA